MQTLEMRAMPMGDRMGAHSLELGECPQAPWGSTWVLAQAKRCITLEVISRIPTQSILLNALRLHYPLRV